MPRDRERPAKAKSKASSFSYEGPQKQIGGAPQQDRASSVIFGLIFSFVGIAIILLAAGVIPSPEAAFKAPRWVVGAAGGIFAMAGMMVFLQGLGVPQNSIIFRILGPVLLVAMATPFTWIVLGDSHAPLEARVLVGLFMAFFGGAVIFASVMGSNTQLMRRMAKDNPELLEKIAEVEKARRKK